MSSFAAVFSRLVAPRKTRVRDIGPDWLTTKEIENRLGVDRATLARHLVLGRLERRVVYLKRACGLNKERKCRIFQWRRKLTS